MNCATGRAACRLSRRAQCPASIVAVAIIALASGALDAHARRTGPPRTHPIDMVVVHSTGGPTCDAGGKPIWVHAGTLDEDLREVETHPVIGIHWMIDRDGTVRRSIPEDQVAHHVFTYSGRSIAIELVNEGDGIDPFPEPQLAALVSLLRDIRQRHRIPRSGMKRHSDLDFGRLPCDSSQRRKVDPGDAFPFESVIERVWLAGTQRQ